MAFDINSAKPVGGNSPGGFDLKNAKPVGGFDLKSAKPVVEEKQDSSVDYQFAEEAKNPSLLDHIKGTAYSLLEGTKSSPTATLGKFIRNRAPAAALKLFLSEKDYNKIKDMTSEQRAQELEQSNQGTIKKITGVTNPEQIPKAERTVGNILGSMADPTTVIMPASKAAQPLTRLASNATRWGALTGTQSAVRQLDETGKIDPKQTGVDALLGAGFSVVGEGLTNAAGAASAARKLGKGINPKTGKRDATIMAEPISPETITKVGQMFDPNDVVHGIGPLKGLETEPHVTLQSGLETANPKVVKQIIPNKPLTGTVQGIKVFSIKNADIVVLGVQGDDLSNVHNTLKQLPNHEKFPDYNPHITLAYVKPGTGAKYAKMVTGLEGKQIQFGQVTFSDAARHHTTLSETPSYTAKAENPTIANVDSAKVALNTTIRDETQLGDFTQITKDHIDSGTITSEDMMHAIHVSGARWDSPEGLVYDTINSGGMPWSRGQNYKVVGKWGDNIPGTEIPEYNGDFNATGFLRRTYTPMDTVISRYGDAGNAVAEGLNLAHTSYRVSSGTSRFDIAKSFKPIEKDPALMDQFNKGITNQVPLNTLDTKVQQAIMERRTGLKGVYKQAYDVGMISRSDMSSAFQRIDSGQMPVMFDELRLNTNGGRQVVGNLLGKYKNNSTKLEQVVKSLIGEDQPSFVVDAMKRVQAGDNVVEVTNDILKIRGATRKMNRSKHLSDAFPPSDIRAELGPVTIQNPKLVLSEFHDDILRQVEFSKIFGADDSKFKALVDEIDYNAKMNGDKTGIAGNITRDAYYTAVGDVANSETIQRQIKYRTESKSARLNDAAAAFETHKMILSAIPNSSQTLVNGLPWLAKNQVGHNPFTPIKQYLQGIHGLMKEGGRDFAKRAGAAMETSGVQYSRQIADAHNTIMGKHISGPLEILNDPNKLLNVNAFLPVEEANHIVATNVGKAYLEDLLEKKAALLGKGNISKGGQKTLKQIDDKLNYFGIDTSLHPDAIPERQMLMGAQKIDAEINFTSANFKTPQWFNNPYFKLISQYKRFATYQSRFLIDNIIKPARHGNFKPLLYWVAATQVAGEGVTELKDWITNRNDKQLSLLDAVKHKDFEAIGTRAMRNIANTSSLGFLVDAALSFDPKGSVIGPAGNDLFNIVQGARNTGSNVVKDLNRHGKVTAWDFSPLGKAVVNTERGIVNPVIQSTRNLSPQIDETAKWLNGEIKKPHDSKKSNNSKKSELDKGLITK